MNKTEVRNKKTLISDDKYFCPICGFTSDEPGFCPVCAEALTCRRMIKCGSVASEK